MVLTAFRAMFVECYYVLLSRTADVTREGGRRGRDSCNCGILPTINAGVLRVQSLESSESACIHRILLSLFGRSDWVGQMRVVSLVGYDSSSIFSSSHDILSCRNVNL